MRLPDDAAKPREGKAHFPRQLRARRNGYGEVARDNRQSRPPLLARPFRQSSAHFGKSNVMRFWCRPRPRKCRLKGRSYTSLRADSSAELRPVKLGQRQEELLVIEEGVKAASKW